MSRVLSRVWMLAVVSACGVGCGAAPEPSESGGATGGSVAGESAPVNVVDEAITTECTVPAEGCPCANQGASVDCRTAPVQIGNYVSCEPGKRTCTDGKWGACVGRTAHAATE